VIAFEYGEEFQRASNDRVRSVFVLLRAPQEHTDVGQFLGSEIMSRHEYRNCG
jgi:hypothetical protein